MNNNTAIKVKNLSKLYRIGGPQERYKTFREAVMNAVYSPFRKTRDLLKGMPTGAAGLKETIWALKDVSFEVKRGEVVGIIGRNGAGKTTLLKILSRITEPTEGTVDIYGRVGSLLEVGTGFHPELTGRENIYLNGAILGMRRTEIDRKFDEIVAFAEVEKFIDTPVKHYSSGMYVRLAFAVAAHLDPEILLVDEVLAVGDASFQKKCLGKMGDVAQEGRTVLFVSHNMTAIQELCPIAYWVDNGKLRGQGGSSEIVSQYLSEAHIQAEMDLEIHPGRRAGRVSLMKKIRFLHDDELTSRFKSGGRFSFEVTIKENGNKQSEIALGFLIKNQMNIAIFSTNMRQYDCMIFDHGNKITIKAVIDALPLNPGVYTLSLFLGNASYDLDIIDNAISFNVIWPEITTLAFPPQPGWGPLCIPVRWELEHK